MTQRFNPCFDILPTGQREIWPELKPAPRLGYVLYGGTALALHLGHRQSVDFDFFAAEPLNKESIREAFAALADATVVRDSPNTYVVLAPTPSGPVKISFFGGLSFRRVNDPLRTRDGVLLVASLEDLMATKLKATLDRAEARDYRDIAEMLRAGVSLPRGLGAFRRMFSGGEPAEVLRALAYFEDGDLPTLSQQDKDLLRQARDGVRDVPEVELRPGPLTGAG